MNNSTKSTGRVIRRRFDRLGDAERFARHVEDVIVGRYRDGLRLARVEIVRAP